MEEVLSFLSSHNGKLLSLALVFVGTSDVAIARVIFGKAVREAEAKISPAMHPNELKPLQDQLRAKQIVRKTLTAVGLGLFTFGIFGLTR